jgi:hypothetical protein
MLKQRNDELFDENVRLQQRPHLDFKHLKGKQNVNRFVFVHNFDYPSRSKCKSEYF